MPRPILQHDERDCGAACLAMVANHYGYTDSIQVFRDLTNTDRDGTSIYNIIRAAEKIGFAAEGLFGSFEELTGAIAAKEVKMPFIAHLSDQKGNCHFVVVSGLKDGRVKVLDPAQGRVTWTVDEFTVQWTGSVISLAPGNAFRKQKSSSRTGLAGFLGLLTGQIKQFSGVLLMSVFISGVGIAGAFIFQLIIDNATELAEAAEGHVHHEHEIQFLTGSDWLNGLLETVVEATSHLTAGDISLIFAVLVGLYALAALIEYLRGLAIIEMSRRIDLGLTLPYFDRILDMPLATAQKRRTGDYLSRYADISAIRSAVSTTAVSLVIDTLMAAACGLLLFMQNRELTVMSFAVVILYMLIVTVNYHRIEDANRHFMEESAVIHASLKENIDNLETLKALNAQNRARQEMKTKFNTYLGAAVAKSRLVLGQDTLVAGIEMVGLAAILWRGFSLVLAGHMTMGALITYYMLLAYLITPVKNLAELVPVIQSALVALDRLEDVLSAPAEDRRDYVNFSDSNENYIPQEMTPPAPISEWTVSHVTFGYGRQDPVLQDVSFSFRRGERIVLSGESGCGKTTLAKLFAGFYEPEEGDIFADGRALGSFSKETLREMVAYVSADAGLFAGTILDNLRMGCPTASEGEIKTLCHLLHVDKLIESLPGGYEYVIEEGAVNLSAGQRQRVAIARALLRKPSLLILDEATANLDPGTEAELMDAIDEGFPEMAVMMISHKNRG